MRNLHSNATPVAKLQAFGKGAVAETDETPMHAADLLLIRPLFPKIPI